MSAKTKLCECGKVAVALVYVPQLTNQRMIRLSSVLWLCYDCLHDEMDADIEAGIDLCLAQPTPPWRRELLTTC